MNTYLGACVELGPEDVDEDVVAGSAVTYFEGYLWDPPRAKDAFRKAAEIAHANDRQVSLTLSDSFCVDRFRDEFLELMRNGTVDIIFANDAELKSLYQTSDLASAIAAVREDVAMTAVTKGEQGSTVVTREKTVDVDAHPIDRLEDTTGAGDLYAAGFLFGMATGRDLETCAKIGCVCAREVISHIGPRPEANMQDILRDAGLL